MLMYKVKAFRPRLGHGEASSQFPASPLVVESDEGKFSIGFHEGADGPFESCAFPNRSG